MKIVLSKEDIKAGFVGVQFVCPCGTVFGIESAADVEEIRWGLSSFDYIADVSCPVCKKSHMWRRSVDELLERHGAGNADPEANERLIEP